MKLKLLFACFFIVTCFAPAHAQESASVIMEKAYAQAAKENKKVFIMFHASWCGWCKKMDKNMTSDACAKFFNDNYVVAHIVVKESPKNKNLENPGGEDLLKRYKGEQAGLPFWVIVDTKGVMQADSFDAKAENLGCPSSPEEVAQFITKLKKTSKLTDKQLGVIKEVFTIKK
jgi:thioredoxin-related protein